MTATTAKADLHRSLAQARAGLLWKLDGLSEYDVRRPLTPTDTNLLGMVKHLAFCEVGYFGDTFDRPFPERLPWPDGDDPNADLWATADESRDELVDRYRRACAHADDTIDALAVDAPGRVPHWPADRAEVTLHRMLVHMTAETNRHAGHADILRELVDGAVGLYPDRAGVPEEGPEYWADHHARLERLAREAAGTDGATGRG
ncbi:DinB family protein [Saccharomonospora halophila]|uniref:DinB family protein n=1 Tax=Saccharomonospora halophila TaxID=129922 RepID=UPI00035DA887|nr:DinB family protein [Saccharomonospora halophila]